MRIVVAPDSFKESMSAREAAEAMARGARAAAPAAEVVEIPMSDGGEGFTEAIAAGLGAERREVPVHDALGRPIIGTFAVGERDGERTVALEVASAVGLELIAEADRDLMRANSRGAGELLRAALDAAGDGGTILLGLGGSATNDGGAGMLAALGVRLLSADGRELSGDPCSLADLARMDLSGLDPRLRRVRIVAACDVSNPLLGPEGASAVYGPQKGATGEQVAELDRLLARVERAAVAAGAGERADEPGAGAAGGLGWALLAVAGATMRPGIDVVADVVGLDDVCREADLVLTGEGRVDAQTLSGKTPAGVAAAARRAGVPCVVLAGRVEDGAEALLDHGATALAAIAPDNMELAEALRRGPQLLADAAERALREWRASSDHD